MLNRESIFRQYGLLLFCKISWRDSNIEAIDKKNESSVSWPGPDPLQTQTRGNIFQSPEIRHGRASWGWTLTHRIDLCGFSLAYLSLTDECHHNIHLSRQNQNTKWHLSAFYLLFECMQIQLQLFVLVLPQMFTAFLADSPNLSSDRISTSSFVFFALQIDRNRYFVGRTLHTTFLTSPTRSSFTSLFWCLPPCLHTGKHIF